MTEAKILSDMATENIETKLSPEVREEFAGSTMTKAGRLAMELNAERKRLKQELAESAVLQAELQQANEELTPTTPTGTIDSYVKWIATIFGVVGVSFIECRVYD